MLSYEGLHSGIGQVAATLGGALIIALPVGAYAKDAAANEEVPSTKEALRAEPPASDLDTIVVSGQRIADEYAGGQVARSSQLGVLGNRDIMDAPFNVQAYTSRLIGNRLARGVADILDNDPSARATWSPSAGYSYEEYTIRGVLVNSSDVTLNGLYGLSPTGAMPAEGIERLEVLKGPTAMLGGVGLHGSLGGSINIVPKRAGETPLTVITGTFDGDSLFGGHVDLGRRFGPGGAFGVRLNGVYRDGSDAVDRQTLKLGFGSLSLDYRTGNFHAYLDAGIHRRNRTAPQQPITFRPGFAVPKAPKAGSNFQQSWAELNTDDEYALVRIEYDPAPDWTLFGAIGHKNSDIYSLVAYPTLINDQGDIQQTFAYAPRWQHTTTGELGVRGAFATGSLRHSVSVVGSALQQDFGEYNSNVGGGITNIYRPVFTALPAGVDTQGAVLKTSSNIRLSISASDIVSLFDNKLQFLGGLRLQQIEAPRFNRAGEETSRYNETMLTPSVGVIIKPRQNWSIYANYIEGLTQPFPPANALNSADTFAPLRTRQKEIGTKVDLGRFQLGASLFDIVQPKGILDPVTRRFSLDGEQRVKGLDLNAAGEAWSGLRLLGGVTLLDSEQTKNAGGLNEGREAFGVANVQLNLGGEWDVGLVPGLTLSGLLLHTGRQFVDVANTQRLPGWTRVDIGARYSRPIGDTTATVRLGIENMFNTAYWSSAARDVTLGGPRTVKLSVSMSL